MENTGRYDIDLQAMQHDYETAQPNVIETTTSTINSIVDGVQNGVIGGLDAFAVFKRLEAVFNEAKKTVEEFAQSEAEKYTEKAFTINGVTFTKRQGSERLNYSEDHVCNELEEQLKSRKDLVKLATKSKEPIFDNNGIEVTRVSSKFDKDSLICKFK